MGRVVSRAVRGSLLEVIDEMEIFLVGNFRTKFCSTHGFKHIHHKNSWLFGQRYRKIVAAKSPCILKTYCTMINSLFYELQISCLEKIMVFSLTIRCQS